MRESEEYLEANSILHDDYTEYIPLYYAKDAVKLAYKEGYLEAIDECMSRLTGFTELASWDVEEILNELKKEVS